MRLAGKSVLVTGAARGIGRAIAEACAGQGAELTLVDSDGEALAGAVEELGGDGKAITSASVDVSSSRGTEEMVRLAEKTFGRLDAMINNAGVLHPDDGDAEAVSEEAWEATMRTNLRGVWLSCRAGLPALRRGGGGAIVNIASIVALVGSAISQIAYTASKGGVVAMSRELAVRHASEGIRVNAVCPGLTQTDLAEPLVGDPAALDLRLAQVPMNRLASATEVASAALWLASPDSAFVTGIALPIDGGASTAFIPGPR